jgi:hypothetical protein
MPAMTSQLASEKKLQGHNREQLFKTLYEASHPGCVVEVIKSRRKPDVCVKRDGVVIHNISVKSPDKVIQWELKSKSKLFAIYGDNHLLTEFMNIRTQNDKPTQKQLFVDYFPRAIAYFANKDNFKNFIVKHFTNHNEVDLLAVGNGTSYNIYNFQSVLDYMADNYVVKTSEQQIQINTTDDYLMFSIEIRSDKKCMLIRQDLASLQRVLKHITPVDKLPPV